MGGGARRFEFGWLEVLGLILVFAGGSAIVFFLGIFVGKGLQESRVRSEERVVRLPIDGAARVVSRPTAGRKRVSDRVVLPLPTATAGVRLVVKPAPTATRKPRPTATRVPRPLAPMATPRPARTAARLRPQPTLSVQAVQGSWAVQVNATKDAATARRLIFQLRQKGYRAYLVEVRLRGETWYRVRVGRFATMSEATSAVVRLKNRERYKRAFLVQE
ncbi:MAG: SPOR domain-containing protein [Deltaproteobacteria bacterium]